MRTISQLFQREGPGENEMLKRDIQNSHDAFEPRNIKLMTLNPRTQGYEAHMLALFGGCIGLGHRLQSERVPIATHVGRIQI